MATTPEERAAIDSERVFRRALDEVLTAACTLAASRNYVVFEALERVESACAQLRMLLRTIDEDVAVP
jgi:hypothetical protein